MLRRKTPLKRGGFLKRTGRVRAINPERAAQKRVYSTRRKVYLEAHPFCQIAIAVMGFNEGDVLNHGRGLSSRNCQGLFYQGQFIPVATQVHHRNKCDGERLNDERWWLSASFEWHNWVETNLGAAREIGLSLPIQADKDGRWGDSNQALPTPEFMKTRSSVETQSQL